MPTAFSMAPLVVSPDKSSPPKTFWFDGNGKITLGNGTFARPSPNAFSLVQVQDCPFATPECISVCYVHRLERAEQNVHRAYRHNSRAIREALADPSLRRATERAFAAWIATHCRHGFRWHVSGDIFSREYAEFIGAVCRATPTVRFWIDTRSFPYLAPILGIPNLVVNLSADKDNWEGALWLHREFGLRLCYLTVDGTVPSLPEGSVIFPSHELRGRDLANPLDAPWWQSLSKAERRMVCPPDFFGQSEHLRCGPCKKCLV